MGLETQAQGRPSALSSQSASSFGAGAVLVGSARVLAIASVAVTTIGVARLLGPVESGKFAVLVGLVATLAVVSAIGTDLGVVWMVSGGRWSAGSALSTTGLASVALGLAGICAGLVVYGVAAASALSGIGFLVLLTSLGSLPFALRCLYVSQVALARGRYRSVAVIAGAQAIGAVAAIVLFAALFGLLGAACGLLVAFVFAAAVAGVVGRGLSEGDGRTFDIARLRAAAAFGWKLYAANVLGLIILRFDLFVLNASVGGRQVGYYAAAVAVASLATLGADAVAGVLFPRVAALSSRADAQTDALLDTETRALRHATLALIVGAGLATLILLTLLEPIFGARFAPARVPGLVLLPGTAALGLAGTLYASLAGRGRPGYALTAGLTLAPISVGLYLALIPPFGATGAALASTIAYCASATLAGLFLQRESGRPTLRRLLPGRAELDDYVLFLHRLRSHRCARPGSLP